MQVANLESGGYYLPEERPTTLPSSSSATPRTGSWPGAAVLVDCGVAVNDGEDVHYPSGEGGGEVVLDHGGEAVGT